MEQSEQLGALSAHAHAISYRLLGSRDDAVVVDAECLLWLVAHWERVEPHPLAWCAALAVERSLVRELDPNVDHPDGRRWWRHRLAEMPSSVQVTVALAELCGYQPEQVVALTRRSLTEVEEMLAWFNRPAEFDPRPWGDPAPADWLAHVRELPEPRARLALEPADTPSTTATPVAPAHQTTTRIGQPAAPSAQRGNELSVPTSAAANGGQATETILRPAPLRDSRPSSNAAAIDPRVPTPKRRRGPRMVRLSTMVSLFAVGGVAWAISQPTAERPSFSDRDVSAGTGNPAALGVAIGDDAGCSAENPLPAGATTEAVTTGGLSRTIRISVPPGTDGEPLPLVIDLGEPSLTVEERSVQSDLETLGEKKSFVTLTVGPTATGTWNVGGQSDQPDDVASVITIARDVVKRTCVDPEKVVLLGHGSGALMAGRIACESDTALSAVVMVGGAYGRDDCTVRQNIHIEWASDDPALPQGGGYGDATPVEHRSPGIEPQRLEDVIVAWRTSLDCSEEANVLFEEPIRPRRGWDPCGSGTLTVVSRPVGGHSWWPDISDVVDEAIARKAIFSPTDGD